MAPKVTKDRWWWEDEKMADNVSYLSGGEKSDCGVSFEVLYFNFSVLTLIAYNILKTSELIAVEYAIRIGGLESEDIQTF